MDFFFLEAADRFYFGNTNDWQICIKKINEKELRHIEALLRVVFRGWAVN